MNVVAEVELYIGFRCSSLGTARVVLPAVVIQPLELRIENPLKDGVGHIVLSLLAKIEVQLKHGLLIIRPERPSKKKSRGGYLGLILGGNVN